MEIKACEWCGNEFMPKTSRSRHCSVSCRGKHYYHTHPEYRQAQIDNSRKRLAENHEARAVVLAAGQRWRENNREAAREATRRWEAANKEHCAQKSREWWAAHPEKRKEYRDRWKAEHPKRIRAFWKDNTYRRRALKAEAEGDFTFAEFTDLCNEAGWKCFYCGCGLSPETATADHMIPLSRGGGNGIENIALACRSCNSRKHDKTVEEFMVASPIKEVHY